MGPIANKNENENDIKIITLSARKLSNDEKNILNKGLKFTPVCTENTLNDTHFYEKLDSDPSKAEKLKSTKFLSKHKNCLTKKEHEYMEKLRQSPVTILASPRCTKALDKW